MTARFEGSTTTECNSDLLSFFLCFLDSLRALHSEDRKIYERVIIVKSLAPFDQEALQRADRENVFMLEEIEFSA